MPPFVRRPASDQLADLRAWQSQRDEGARLRLLADVDRFVRGKAWTWHRANPGLDFDDLVSEGRIGVLVAMDRFDASHGACWLTYAALWVRSAFQRASYQRSQVPVPRTKEARRAHGRLASAAWAVAERGEDVTARTVAAEIGCAPEVVDALWHRKGQSLDRALTIDAAPDPEARLSTEQTASHLRALVDTLPDRERDIIRRRWLDGDATLESLGQQHGLTRERIRQLEARAMDRLRKAMA